MFGGDEILEEASKERYGLRVMPVIYLTMMIQITLFFVRINYSRKHKDNYIKTMKISVIEGSTNVYTVTSITINLIFWVFYLKNYFFLLDDKLEEDDKIYKMRIGFCHVILILVLLPYMRSFALR